MAPQKNRQDGIITKSFITLDVRGNPPLARMVRHVKGFAFIGLLYLVLCCFVEKAVYLDDSATNLDLANA